MQNTRKPLSFFGILFVFVLSVPAVGAFAAEAHVDRRAGFSFPDRIGEFSFVGKKRFAVAVAGYVLRYVDRAGTTIDLFVYDGGVRNIKNGTRGARVGQQKKNAIAEIYTALRYGMYRDVKPAPSPASFPAGFLSASYRITDRFGKTRRSHLFIRGQNGHFVKLRASGPDTGLTDKRIAGFATRLLPLVTRSTR